MAPLSTCPACPVRGGQQKAGGVIGGLLFLLRLDPDTPRLSQGGPLLLGRLTSGPAGLTDSPLRGPGLRQSPGKQLSPQEPLFRRRRRPCRRWPSGLAPEPAGRALRCEPPPSRLALTPQSISFLQGPAHCSQHHGVCRVLGPKQRRGCPHSPAPLAGLESPFLLQRVFPVTWCVSPSRVSTCGRCCFQDSRRPAGPWASFSLSSLGYKEEAIFWALEGMSLPGPDNRIP